MRVTYAAKLDGLVPGPVQHASSGFWHVGLASGS